MSISLESLSEEIGSSINKPLPYNGREFQELIDQITQQSSSKMTTESTHNESIMLGNSKNSISNSNSNSSNSSSNSTNNSHTISRQKATEMKIASCSRFYACKYCCQIDLFVMVCFTIIAVLDSCFRLGLSVLVAIECRLYKMFRLYFLAHRNQQSNTIQKIINCFCAFLTGILYIEIYITTGFLKFILKPIPQWISYQIHGLLFKFHSNFTAKDRDFDGLNSNENTS